MTPVAPLSACHRCKIQSPAVPFSACSPPGSGFVNSYNLPCCTGCRSSSRPRRLRSDLPRASPQIPHFPSIHGAHLGPINAAQCREAGFVGARGLGSRPEYLRDHLMAGHRHRCRHNMFPSAWEPDRNRFRVFHALRLPLSPRFPCRQPSTLQRNRPAKSRQIGPNGSQQETAGHFRTRLARTSDGG